MTVVMMSHGRSLEECPQGEDAGVLPAGRRDRGRPHRDRQRAARRQGGRDPRAELAGRCVRRCTWPRRVPRGHPRTDHRRVAGDMIVLDTHALLWCTLDPDKLSPAAVSCLADLESKGGFASAISLWELGIKIQR